MTRRTKYLGPSLSTIASGPAQRKGTKRLVLGVGPGLAPGGRRPNAAHVTQSDRRDRRTGLRFGWGGEPGPEQEEPWLASMPADGVILFFNIRGFKPVNDQYGMAVGDRVLREFARRLQEGAHPWIAYRDGGDEFVVAARLDGEPAIRAFVEPIRASLDRPYELGISVGSWVVAAMALPGQPASERVNAAGFALGLIQRAERAELLILPPGSNGRPSFE